MGADIMGAGTDVIKIRGVSSLKGATYTIIPDQIEAGTYMIAAAATKGDVLVKNVIPKHLESITAKLRIIGATVVENDDSVRVFVENQLRITSYNVCYTKLLREIPEASAVVGIGCNSDISVDGKVAVIEGVGELTGAPVKATDLRAGAALVIAGLAANGVTEIDDIYHIERGYECIEEKLKQLGADIKRKSIPGTAVRQAL